jgi:hypothetical protein
MSKNRLAAFLGIATYCNGILNYSVNFSRENQRNKGHLSGHVFSQ